MQLLNGSSTLRFSFVSHYNYLHYMYKNSLRYWSCNAFQALRQQDTILCLLGYYHHHYRHIDTYDID